jgi:flagellar protein FlbD
MITLTKLDGETMVVNAELIETIGAAPETLVSLTTGRKLWVRETPDEVVRLAVEYQALVRHRMPGAGAGGNA